MPRPPPLDPGQLGVVAGVLGGLGVAGYVVNRVVQGGQGSGSGSNADASTSPSPTPTVRASVIPGPGSQGHKPGKSGSAKVKTQPKKHFTLENVGGPSIAELTQAVEKLLQADPTKPPAQFTVSSL